MGHETLHGTVPAQMGMLDSTVLRQQVGNANFLFCAVPLPLRTHQQLFSPSAVLLLFHQICPLNCTPSRACCARRSRPARPRRAQLWLGYGTAAIKAPHEACASEPGRHGRGRHLAHV